MKLHDTWKAQSFWLINAVENGSIEINEIIFLDIMLMWMLLWWGKQDAFLSATKLIYSFSALCWHPSQMLCTEQRKILCFSEDFVLFCNSTSLQLLYLIFHLIFPHLHVLFHFCCLSFLCNVMRSHNYCSSVECLSFLQKVEPFLEHMPCQKLISIFRIYFYENYNFCITRILIWLCFNLV